MNIYSYETNSVFSKFKQSVTPRVCMLIHYYEHCRTAVRKPERCLFDVISFNRFICFNPF